MDITITKVEHGLEYDTHNPLVQQTPSDDITVWVDAEGIIEGWPIRIPVAALDTRKAIYELGHDEDALEAIVREWGLHMHPTIHNLDVRTIRAIDESCEYLDWKKKNAKPQKLEPQGDLKLHEFGGTHDGIKIKYGSGARQQRDTIVEKISDRPGLHPVEQQQFRALALLPADASTQDLQSDETVESAEASQLVETSDPELAETILELLNERPEYDVRRLADYLHEPVGRIVQVLDEYHVGKRGVVTHRGPGQGGGWPS